MSARRPCCARREDDVALLHSSQSRKRRLADRSRNVPSVSILWLAHDILLEGLLQGVDEAVQDPCVQHLEALQRLCPVQVQFSEPAQPSTARTGSAATHFTESASATSRTPPHLGGRGPALTHTRVPDRTASSAGPSSSRYCAWSRSKARSSVTATVTGRASKSAVTDAHLTGSSWDVAS